MRAPGQSTTLQEKTTTSKSVCESLKSLCKFAKHDNRLTISKTAAMTWSSRDVPFALRLTGLGTTYSG